jgi:fused signal recognition particle receptor
MSGVFGGFRKVFSNTGDLLAGRLLAAITGKMALNDAALLEMEEALISADVGLKTSADLIYLLKDAVRKKEITDPVAIKPFLRSRIESFVTVPPQAGVSGNVSPHVILMVGVNGAGKTTTIGKLAFMFSAEGKSVLVAAGDTFRAAAIEQLAQWCSRTGCELIRHQPGADPSAVAFDAIRAAKARDKSVMIMDTAGRLHTRTNLMEELKKVRRIIAREMEGAPHETLLVIDGSTGQNAINQIKEFHSNIGITGIVITKLDGTSKGGAVVGIINETKIPVKYIGVGEAAEDLQPFDPKAYGEALIP